MTKMNLEVEELNLLSEIINLRSNLQNAQNKSHEFNFLRYSTEFRLPKPDDGKLPTLYEIYKLRAHLSRIHDVIWSPTDKNILTIGSEGFIILWNIQTGLIHNVLDATSVQPLSAAFFNNCEHIICGGLCANVVIYQHKHRLPEDGYSVYETTKVFEHSGQINHILNINETKMLTNSTPDGIKLWDIETSKVLNQFPGLRTDVLSLCRIGNDESTFLFGDKEGIIFQWDTRQSGSSLFGNGLTSIYEPHLSYVNCMQMLPNNYNFVTGSEDEYIHLYDIRTDVTLAKFNDVNTKSKTLGVNDQSDRRDSEHFSYELLNASVCDLAVSSSGRLVISGCRNSMMYYWDLTEAVDTCLKCHLEDGPVIKVAMSHDKTALILATWDSKNQVRMLRPKKL